MASSPTPAGSRATSWSGHSTATPAYLVGTILLVIVLALLLIVVILVPTSATAQSAFQSDYQVISYLVAFDGPVFALLISVARFVPEAALLCWINTQR